jgi:hypothetical protein
MVYVEEHEAELLRVCANPLATNDIRGRLFELVVISRFRKEKVVSRDPDLDVLPGQVDAGSVFNSQKLPEPSIMQKNTLFISKNSKFPCH